MICGALQTLNEEACEDVLEETEETKIVIEGDVPQTSVIPPSPDQANNQGESRHSIGSERPLKKVSYDDNVVVKVAFDGADSII